jgi:hypothetical protein
VPGRDILDWLRSEAKESWIAGKELEGRMRFQWNRNLGSINNSNNVENSKSLSECRIIAVCNYWKLEWKALSWYGRNRTDSTNRETVISCTIESGPPAHLLVGTPGGSVCRLCHAGTYWTGSGQWQITTHGYDTGDLEKVEGTGVTWVISDGSLEETYESWEKGCLVE